MGSGKRMSWRGESLCRASWGHGTKFVGRCGSRWMLGRRRFSFEKRSDGSSALLEITGALSAKKPPQMTSSKLTSCLVAVWLALPRFALGWSVHVTCTDGAPTAVVRSGEHRGEFAGVCDLDATADGVCTFYSDRTVLRCRVAGGPGCQDVGDDSPPAPCPFSSPPIAVRLRPRHRESRAVSVFRPSNPRYPAEGLVLRCVRGRPDTPTTTTTLPGVPNMTGDWAFDVATLSNDCPGGLVPFVGAPMLIEQTGSNLRGCRMGYLGFQGAVLPGGFAFNPRAFSGQPPGRPLYDLVSTIQGAVSSGGTIDVTETLDGHASGGTASSCTVLWHGTVTPRSGSPCADHSDCIRLEGPCSRCQDGFCRVPPPFCRAGPGEPTRVGTAGRAGRIDTARDPRSSNQ